MYHDYQDGYSLAYLFNLKNSKLPINFGINGRSKSICWNFSVFIIVITDLNLIYFWRLYTQKNNRWKWFHDEDMRKFWFNFDDVSVKEKKVEIKISIIDWCTSVNLKVICNLSLEHWQIITSQFYQLVVEIFHVLPFVVSRIFSSYKNSQENFQVWNLCMQINHLEFGSQVHHHNVSVMFF